MLCVTNIPHGDRVLNVKVLSFFVPQILFGNKIIIPFHETKSIKRCTVLNPLLDIRRVLTLSGGYPTSATAATSQ